MTLYLHEMKRGRISLIIWSAVIAFMILVCIVIYPEIEAQMDEMSEMFANMGAFSEAFSMDQLSFGSFIGFFSVECGEMLGIGGACFAAIMGISALSKEENDKAAEFLLTHPIPRKRIVLSKLLSVFSRIFILNVFVAAVSFGAVAAIGVEAEWGIMALIFLAYFLVQLEVSAVCFFISSLIRRRGVGIGLGVAMFFYFANIIANITEKTEFLKYVTPFAYTDGAYIIDKASLDWKFVAISAAVTLFAAAFAFHKYEKKDIH